MNAIDMSGKCAGCQFAQPLRYADGHNSIRCTHPSNDINTTRDIIILEQCPKEVSGENGKEIVMYKGKPAVVITYSSNGKAVTLRLSRNDFKTVMLSEVQPYTGNKDAISLGF